MKDLAKTTDPAQAAAQAAPQQGKADQAAAQPPLELDRTLLHTAAVPATTDSAASARGTKQSHDLAFAVALLQTGQATMRTLSLAAQSWTTYGSQSLADHLLASKTISPEQRTTIEQRARQTLARMDARSDRSDPTQEGGGPSKEPLSQTARERHWLDQLDPSGKVAKLLGIADSSMLSHEEIEDRQVGSRYTLLRKLGQGGLGIVWLARDQNLQRYVAVKEIARDVAQGHVALEHFRREAEITGRLEHPGIVPVHQYGQDAETGKAFYVMRFLGKRTMQDAISEYHERREAGNDDPMLLHRLLSAMINVCHAVGHAHSRQVIHRDLKPENVALDEFGQVTLLDWGLAKINDATGMYEVNGRTEPGDLHSVGSTQVGRVIGTPFYMAPEQAAGRLEEVDELTDVYALGGMLYAILTGVAPHQAALQDADSGSNLSDIMSEIVSGSIRTPRDVVSSVAPELDAVCMKALSSKRYLRYGSATELEEEIQRFIAGTPVEAYTPPAKQRIKRWMSDHPTLTQSILLATSLLLIGGAAIGYTMRQGQIALQQARYTSVQEFTRELEVNLNFETSGMVRNLQFVSELPLMEAIVWSQQNESHTDVAATDVEVDTTAVRPITQVSLAGLLNRQGNLFDGLLNANPAYLRACTCVENEDGSITELIRTERVAAGSRVHRVPKKQLSTCQPKDPDLEDAVALDTMRPNQVLLVTNDQLTEDVPVNSRSPLALSGLDAVFDSEGAFFGINVIELDLQRRLEQLFTAVAPENVSVCVTDAFGNIVLRYEKGRFTPVDSVLVTEEFPQLKPFFATASTATEFGDGKTVFARRVQLGGSPKAKIGIVAHIQGE